MSAGTMAERLAAANLAIEAERARFGFARCDFQAWLDAMDGRGVGFPRSSTGCPLARFLTARNGRTASVGHHGYILADYGTGPQPQRQPLPAWGSKFARLVDARINSWEVSAEAARAMLSDAGAVS